jgi:hypothetical protein
MMTSRLNGVNPLWAKVYPLSMSAVTQQKAAPVEAAISWQLRGLGLKLQRVFPWVIESTLSP